MQTQVRSLERFSDLALIKSELQKVKSLVFDLSKTTIPSFTQTVETSSVQTQTTLPDQSAQTTACADESTRVPLPSPSSVASPSLKVAAWNCRGVNNALPYVEFLADSHDVIVVSEH